MVPSSLVPDRAHLAIGRKRRALAPDYQQRVPDRALALVPDSRRACVLLSGAQLAPDSDINYRVFDWHYRAPYGTIGHLGMHPIPDCALSGVPRPIRPHPLSGVFPKRTIVDMVVYRAFDWHYRAPLYRMSSNFNSFESLSKQRPIWAHLIG